MEWLYILIVVVLIAAILVAVIVSGSDSVDEVKTTRTKSLFKQCRNNFDCDMAYHCELRNHPSVGICVIPPGGTCHKDKNDVCYSGYVCDHQDGTCVKKN